MELEAGLVRWRHMIQVVEGRGLGRSGTNSFQLMDAAAVKHSCNTF